MKMKIILIQCPCWSVKVPPLGLGYLNAYLRQKGFDSRIFDFNLELFLKSTKKQKELWKETNEHLWREKKVFKKIGSGFKKEIETLAKNICKEKTKLIGLSIFESTLNFSLLLAKKIKEIDKTRIIILGGPECFKQRAGHALISKKYVDAVVYGEGETTFLELAQQVRKNSILSGCKGALVKEKGKITDLGERTLIKNISQLPFPDYEGTDMKNYSLKDSYSIMGCRGCTGNCIYCYEKNIWKEFRGRKAENIFKEIKYAVKKYSKRKFEFTDSMINGNLKEMEKLCALLIDNQMKIRWTCQARIDHKLTLNMLKKMKQ